MQGADVKRILVVANRTAATPRRLEEIDPFEAIREAVSGGRFDEIIISTLRPGASRSGSGVTSSGAWTLSDSR